MLLVNNSNQTDNNRPKHIFNHFNSNNYLTKYTEPLTNNVMIGSKDYNYLNINSSLNKNNDGDKKAGIKNIEIDKRYFGKGGSIKTLDKTFK